MELSILKATNVGFGGILTFLKLKILCVLFRQILAISSAFFIRMSIDKQGIAGVVASYL